MKTLETDANRERENTHSISQIKTTKMTHSNELASKTVKY